MTDQPPVQPPHQPPAQEPSGRPAEGSPATQPMPAVAGTAAAPPQAATTTTVWHQATSTHGGRLAIAVAAGALACLLLLGVVATSLVVLRGHDRVSMMGQRQDGFSRDRGDQGRPGDGWGDQGRRGDGRGPGAQNGNPQQPGMPGGRGGAGMPQGGAQGLGGLGGLLGGTALHGNLSTTVNGSVQALVFQRGEVTAVSATSVTLKSTDGFTGTYGINAATSSLRAAPVKGGQAFVLARASDKVAITLMSTPAGAGTAPGS